MEDEENRLLFLNELYKGWPWHYDKDSKIEIQQQIINMLFRKIAKFKHSNDIEARIIPKINKKFIKKDFQPTFVD